MITCHGRTPIFCQWDTVQTKTGDTVAMIFVGVLSSQSPCFMLIEKNHASLRCVLRRQLVYAELSVNSLNRKVCTIQDAHRTPQIRGFVWWGGGFGAHRFSHYSVYPRENELDSEDADEVSHVTMVSY